MIKCQEKEDTLSERVMNFMKKRAIGAKDVTSIHFRLTGAQQRAIDQILPHDICRKAISRPCNHC